MDLTTVAEVCGAVLVATLVQQVSGFGYALLAVPLLSLAVGPKDAVAIAMGTGFASSGLMAVGLRDRIERPTLRRLVWGGAVGLPIGVLGLRALDADVLRLGLGVVVIAMVVVLASGARLRAHGPRSVVAAGVAAGLLNGSLGTAGPPVILVLQAADTEQHRFRATTTAFFAIGDLAAIPLLVASGAIRGSAWLYALTALPTLLVGSAVGGRLALRLDAEQFRRLVLVLLVVTGVVLVATALRG
ncbi:sulfite exporter TauE/SafE family protein [soil metagenome]